MAGEVTFQMTEADYAAASRTGFLTMLIRRKTPFWVLVAMALAFLTGMAIDRFAYCAPLTVQLTSGAVLAFGGLAWLLMIYALGYMTIPRRARRLFRQSAAMHRPQTMAWSDAGIEHRSATGTATYPWRDLHGWSDRRCGMMLYFNESVFVLIPSHAIDDAARRDLVGTIERSGLARI